MEESADKIFVTPHAVILLDGASAFVPVPVPASAYADYLGRLLADALTADPAADLQEILAEGIKATAAHYDLRAGESPSSTVTIARERDEHLDLLLLGDNTVILPGGEILTDDRIDRLDLEPRRKYRERLAAGHGYDDEHRALLRELQTQQAQYRNKPGGYWIAEADPLVARQAVLTARSLSDTRWFVIASDGAYNVMEHLNLVDWADYAKLDGRGLITLLHHCQEWEENDGTARRMPRAKKHDDKSIAVANPSQEIKPATTPRSHRSSTGSPPGQRNL
ncbi:MULTISPECIES: PP2C family serine/threonine-protein phosphatase [Amycolatopsis]|uniref:PP2C family serine/threonine-protein phosphatase n=1 Tax=Amycolatopsis TaxID=1813 RepID=UPI0018E9CC05|nr:MULTISPECIES: PP2C family serine/threonine-protein phosphatase [Amycolatopsis]